MNAGRKTLREGKRYPGDVVDIRAIFFDTVWQKIDTECVLLYTSCNLMPDVLLLASDK